VATFLVEAIENEVATLRERGVTCEEYDQPGPDDREWHCRCRPIKGASIKGVWFKAPMAI
jgi:hypothetical protein